MNRKTGDETEGPKLPEMSYGAPVICFSIEGLSWIPEIAAVKVKPYEVSQFAKSMTKIATDEKYTQKMIQEANNYAKHFTWDAVANLYDNYIGSLIKKS